jgi:hypothetical protein
MIGWTRPIISMKSLALYTDVHLCEDSEVSGVNALLLRWFSTGVVAVLRMSTRADIPQDKATIPSVSHCINRATILLRACNSAEDLRILIRLDQVDLPNPTSLSWPMLRLRRVYFERTGRTVQALCYVRLSHCTTKSSANQCAWMLAYSSSS